MERTKFIGTVCVFITTVAYGLVPAVSFMSFGIGVETETLLFSKFFYAGFLLWIYILIRKLPFKVKKKDIKPLVVICVAYIGIATTLYMAFDYISGSLATIISFTFPAIVVAVEMIRKIETVKISKIAAVIISMIGMLFVIWAPNMSGNMIGILFAFGTAVCYSVYMFGLASPTIKKMNPFVVSGYVLMASGIFNLIRCVISEKPFVVENLTQFGYMLFLAIICAFLPILLNAIGVKKIGPGNAAIVSTAEPLFACLFGYLLVGDILTSNMIIGGFLIMGAVIIANWPRKNK